MVSGIAGLLGRPYLLLWPRRLHRSRNMTGYLTTRLGLARRRGNLGALRQRERAAVYKLAAIRRLHRPLTEGQFVEPGPLGAHLRDRSDQLLRVGMPG